MRIIKVEDKEWLTVSEVAKVFGMHPITVYRMVEQGRLPAARVGRAIRIPVSAIVPPALRRFVAAKN